MLKGTTTMLKEDGRGPNITLKEKGERKEHTSLPSAIPLQQKIMLLSVLKEISPAAASQISVICLCYCQSELTMTSSSTMCLVSAFQKMMQK